jgi:hypothetical protein
LELAIGTGRIALPLAERGVDVVGIDASDRMIAKLRCKPGGDVIPVTMGNSADVSVDGLFRLVYVVFTTLFALPSQAEQIRCLRNVAAHLEPQGCFVMDAFVPDLGRYHSNQAVTTQRVSVDSVVLDASRHEPIEQRIDSSHVLITPAGVQLFPVSIRYAWPAELDAMAMVAGLQLTDRWASYDRAPFVADSLRHVSVYTKPGDGPGCQQNPRAAHRAIRMTVQHRCARPLSPASGVLGLAEACRPGRALDALTPLRRVGTSAPVEQTEVEGSQHGTGAVADAELEEHVGDVVLDGAGRQV